MRCERQLKNHRINVFWSGSFLEQCFLLTSDVPVLNSVEHLSPKFVPTLLAEHSLRDNPFKNRNLMAEIFVHQNQDFP